MDELDDRDREVLDVLADGRANPYLIRDETGLEKGDTNTVLNRLGRSGYVRQITRGLYEITERGLEEVAEEDDERPNVDTREIVDDWLWEHHGFGVDDLDDAQESLRELLAARGRADPVAAGDAVDELADALGVERDA